ncbi:phage tail tip lysozyme [Kribbella sp. NPDC048915]|uniref:phage tail tip lysozyme n=1 Tax=Kribbella sp. NPDC048915 TaxID=3155148 RepID=UPI0033F4CCE6
MEASKLLRIAAGLVLLVSLSLGIVLLMLLGVLGGLDSAEAQCAQAEAENESLMGYPTDRQQIDSEWTPFHRGYDFRVEQDDPVYASHDGKVMKASDNEVRIRLESVETRYKFLKTITVNQGAEVKRGDKIGTAGTGSEGTDAQGAPIGIAGAHIHWEMWADQKNDGNWSIVPKPDENPFVVDSSKSSACSCVDGNLSGANNQQKAFNFFVQNGYSKEQAAGIVGNMISESSVEPGRLQGTNPGTVSMPSEVINSSLGWGIVQWTPAGKMIRPSRDDGVSDETIASLGYQLEFLLKQLRGEGPLPEGAAGTALKAANSVEDAAFQFGHKFERFAGSENPSHPRYAERKANARHVYQQFADSAPSGGDGGETEAAASTGGACGAGSGNIAEVAKNLAWPEGGHNGTDASLAKPEFVQAMAQYNDGPNGYVPYSDCGRFVATVMRMSGADPNFPKVSTGVQFDYMMNSGKYDSWHAVPPGGMKPGDILNGPGHTYLYVGPWGKDGGGYDSASGSLGQHVPEATHLYDVGGQFWVFRLKNAPQTNS